MKSAQELGDKLESKAEKILFGKDLYLGAGGEQRKAETERKTLDDMIKSAEQRKSTQDPTGHQPEKGPER